MINVDFFVFLWTEQLQEQAGKKSLSRDPVVSICSAVSLFPDAQCSLLVKKDLSDINSIVVWPLFLYD